VAGAKVTLTVSEGEALKQSRRFEETSKHDGSATFTNIAMDFENFPLGAPANAFISVEPPDGQRSSGRAGPDLPRGSTEKEFLFRGFSIALHIHGDGGARRGLHQPLRRRAAASRGPSFGASLEGDLEGLLIDIDWRPIGHGGSHASERSTRASFAVS